MPVATIIAGIIAASTAIAGGVMNAKAQREANETNLGLSEQSRQDNLKQIAIANKQNATATALNQRQQSFVEKEAALNRGERTEQKTYDRLQNAANIYTKILNEQTVLRNNNMAPLISGGK
jgi:hypothetical protein